jgi:hypothetical protein
MPDNGITSLLESALKIVGGIGGGTVVGYFAQKKAAQSSAVKEMQLIKKEYKEFADFTKKELLLSREHNKDCQDENKVFREEISTLKIDVTDLTIAMHNAIGTPKNKRKGLNNGG